MATSDNSCQERASTMSGLAPGGKTSRIVLIILEEAHVPSIPNLQMFKQSHSSCRNGFTKLRSSHLCGICKQTYQPLFCAPTQTQGGGVEESHIAHLPKHLEPSQADRDGNCFSPAPGLCKCRKRGCMPNNEEIS